MKKTTLAAVVIAVLLVVGAVFVSAALTQEKAQAATKTEITPSPQPKCGCGCNQQCGGDCGIAGCGCGE